MPFKTRMRVRFGDVDRAQIVFYPRFFNYFHTAFEDFFTEQGHEYRHVIDDVGVGFPTVHIETDFHRALRFGDVFEIEVGVERVGNTSATFRYIGRKDGELVLEARITFVCVDMKTLRPTPIPAPYRALFEKNRI